MPIVFRLSKSVLVAATLLGACHSATLEKVGEPSQPEQQLNIAPDSPYQIELVSGGQPLPTYAHNGRFYVLGQVGQRYGIRVSNPTPLRVEAVISVDGLDVIDGETANTEKRGYVIAPGGSITVDGFRVSSSHIAAFRFSSVNDSYAGRKGVARNVGAIGVAIFSERARQPLILPEEPIHRRERWGSELDRGGDDEYAGDDVISESSMGGSADASKSDRTTIRPKRVSRGGLSAKIAPRSGLPSPAPEQRCCRETSRPGLGTEYGERRYSVVGFTRFERAHPTEPTAYAELRYNNAAGLAALGIITGSNIDNNELTRRETAEPFPGQRFATPPQ